MKNVIPKHLEAISAKLMEMGCEVVEFDEEIRVVGKPKQRHMNFKTLPYPGFPTDMQPQMTVALALADGTSVVTESIFENRFKYVDELSRMGANIKVEGSVAIVDGVSMFTGAQVVAPDSEPERPWYWPDWPPRAIRWWTRIGYIERGYENFEEKLRSLGACIERVDSRRKPRRCRSSGWARQVPRKFQISY